MFDDIVRDPEVKIQPFRHIHPYMADLREFEREYLRIADWKDRLRSYEMTGNAYTAMVGKKIACCFGYVDLWPGVAEAWMMTTDHVNTKPVSLTRAASRYFDHIATRSALHRIQITVNGRHDIALRWASALKFTQEGVLRQYGHDRTDYIIFARYY